MTRRCPRNRCRDRWLWWPVCLAIVVACGVAAAPRAKGPNVPQPTADCRTCHTADRATLNNDPARARTLLIGNLEATCNRCHGDQGPSHKTGMPPKTNVPGTLPLSSAGQITCATC